MKGKSYPENLAPLGPISSTLLARASPSISGGGCVSFSRLTSLHVTRVGWHALPGGTIIRTPEWRQPRIAPPRASTMKLTKKLKDNINCFKENSYKYILCITLFWHFMMIISVISIQTPLKHINKSNQMMITKLLLYFFTFQKCIRFFNSALFRHKIFCHWSYICARYFQKICL